MTSFPFLAIAREFGVPYGAIIRIAHCWSHGEEFTPDDVDASLACNAIFLNALIRSQAPEIDKLKEPK